MDDEFNKKIHNSSAQYQRKLLDIVASVESLWSSIASSSHKQLAQKFLHTLRELSGGAGAHGYLKISEIAQETEAYLQRDVKYWQNEFISGQINQLKAEAKKLELLAKKKEQSAIDKNKSRKDKLVYCIVDSSMQNVFNALHQFGYNIEFFDNFAGLSNKNRPDVLIIDIKKLVLISLPVLEAIFQNWEAEIPIIYISAQDDVETRLKAVRYCGSSFMVMPIKVYPLIEKLEYLASEPETKSSRVLMLDNSGNKADYYQLLMQDAGIIVKKIEDPEFLLLACEEFQPDLIIMDIKLQSVSGFELAKVLRQDERYSTIPIIYISAIPNKDMQLNALEVGADDIISKPINPKYLISMVKSKITRANMLRSRIMRDSLTKLYNHTFIHQHLEVAIKVAQRYHSPLAFVMLDIDNFKIINDTFGHPVGDRVLRNLSQFLRQHLRESDVIGRYGGEEFAIILPYTDPIAALQLFDQLRKDFAVLNQLGDDENLNVTFSVGIARYSEYFDSQILIAAADKALYQAKENGRNKVVIFAE